MRSGAVRLLLTGSQLVNCEKSPVPMNKLKSIAKAFVEQGVSSLGSFLFFFALARWLEPDRFGRFSAIWISIQAVVSIAMAWVYLPITSMLMPHEEGEAVFYGVCLQRLLKLLLWVPALMIFAICIAAKEILTLPLVLIITIFLCVATLTVDFLRYYLIRRGYKMGATILVFAKWGTGISLVLLLHKLQILTVNNAIFCMLAGNIFALIITIIMLQRLQCSISVARNEELNYRLTSFSKPLLFQALSNSASGVIVAFAMRNWISTAALGAYQAMRSICNIVSPLIQMIGTHYSVHLTRKADLKGHNFMEYSLLIAGGGLVYLTWLFAVSIIKNTIGVSYLAYSFLPPVIMFHTVAILAANLASARVRRIGNTRVFVYCGLIGLSSGIMLIPTAKYTGSAQLVALVMAIGTVAQFVVLKINILLFAKGRY